jgi:hypothetical protein
MSFDCQNRNYCQFRRVLATREPWTHISEGRLVLDGIGYFVEKSMFNHQHIS